MSGYVNGALTALAAGASAASAAKKGYSAVKSGVSNLHKGIKKVSPALKNAASKAKYAGEVGKAGLVLAGRVANPVRRAKFVADAVRGKGFVLPGSKYIGPGNEMNKGKPVDKADANAYQHDVDYDNYIKKGHKAKDVYLGYSDADERLLKNTKANTPNGLAVNLGMLAKKGLNKTGLTKRIRDTDEPGVKKERVARGVIPSSGVLGGVKAKVIQAASAAAPRPETADQRQKPY